MLKKLLSSFLLVLVVGCSAPDPTPYNEQVVEDNSTTELWYLKEVPKENIFEQPVPFNVGFNVNGAFKDTSTLTIKTVESKVNIFDVIINDGGCLNQTMVWAKEEKLEPYFPLTVNKELTLTVNCRNITKIKIISNHGIMEYGR